MSEQSNSSEHFSQSPPSQAASPGLWLRAALTGLFTLLMAAAVSWGFSQMLVQIEARQAEHAIELTADSTAFSVRKGMHDHIRMIERMAHRWEVRGGTPRLEWEADAGLLTQQLPGLQSVLYLDPTGQVLWRVPTTANALAPEREVSGERNVRQAMQESLERRRAMVSKPISLTQNGKGIVYCHPLYVEDEFQGYLMAVLRVQQLLRRELGGTLSDYHVRITSDGELIYANSTGDPVRVDTMRTARLVNLDYLNWKVVLSTKSSRLEAIHDQSTLAFQAGLGFSVIMGLVVGFVAGIRAQQRALRQANRALELQLTRSLQARADELQQANRKLTQANDDMAREISEREAAQNALRATESRWRETIELAPFPIMVHAEDGEVLSVNRAWTELTGYDRDRIVTLNDWMSLARGLDAAEVTTHTTRIFRSSTSLHEGEQPIRTADGEKRIWDIHSAPLAALPDGRRTVINIASDVTERKQRSQELATLNDDLQRSNSELEQFAYVASHDLQEPLRMITSYLQLLSRRYQGQLDANADEFIEFAVDGASRMQLLINNLLQYSRVTTRGLEFQPVEAGMIMDQVLHDLQYQISDSGATVICSENMPTVYADPVQLKQLLQNLISNAIKFVDGDAATVEVRVKRLLTVAEFRVRDNGIGIDPEHFEKIFKIFQRLHGRRTYTGTGIGLAICQRIVERHGGRIHVESKPGDGSTFIFTIPLPPQSEDDA